MTNSTGNRIKSTTTCSLHALFIGSSLETIHRCVDFLNAAAFDVQPRVAANFEELLECARYSQHDIVIMERLGSRLLGIDGLCFLHQEFSQIPLIIVGPKGSDEWESSWIGPKADGMQRSETLEWLPEAVVKALERKEALNPEDSFEELREENEDRFRFLANELNEAVFIEHGTRNMFVNRAAELLTGYSRAELTPLNFWRLILPSSRRALLEGVLADPGESDSPSRHLTRILTKSGQVRHVELAVQAIKMTGSLAAVISASDVTGKKWVGQCEAVPTQTFGLENPLPHPLKSALPNRTH